MVCFFLSTGLNLEQVDTLWSCLALDKECSDDCLSWFLNQAKSKDHHAMGLETFKHIFLEKVGFLSLSVRKVCCAYETILGIRHVLCRP